MAAHIPTNAPKLDEYNTEPINRKVFAFYTLRRPGLAVPEAVTELAPVVHQLHQSEWSLEEAVFWLFPPDPLLKSGKCQSHTLVPDGK